MTRITEMENVLGAIRIIESRIDMINDEANADVQFLRTLRYHTHLLLAGAACSLWTRFYFLRFRYYVEGGK